MKRLVSFLSLFTSVGTLVCCALPALLVVLGMGAALAGLVGAVPQIVWLSENKLWLFGIGAILLSAGGLMQWRARFEPCPLDPDLAKACTSARRSSFWLYAISLGIYLVGAFFAFVAPILNGYPWQDREWRSALCSPLDSLFYLVPPIELAAWLPLYRSQ